MNTPADCVNTKQSDGYLQHIFYVMIIAWSGSTSGPHRRETPLHLVRLGCRWHTDDDDAQE